jgi:hypothetical protein
VIYAVNLRCARRAPHRTPGCASRAAVWLD